LLTDDFELVADLRPDELSCTFEREFTMLCSVVARSDFGSTK